MSFALPVFSQMNFGRALSGSYGLPPASPAAKRISQLAKGTLIGSSRTVKNLPEAQKSEIRALNERFQFFTARVEALFTAMYRTGVATQRDLEAIKDYSLEFAIMSRESTFLPLADQQKASAKIREMGQHLVELAELGTDTQRLAALRERFDAASEQFTDCMSYPVYPGEILAEPTMDRLRQVVRDLHHYQKDVASLPKGSMSESREKWAFERTARSLSVTLGVWETKLKNALDHEANYLKQALKKDPDNEDLVRQLHAFHQQQRVMIKDLQMLHRVLERNPELKFLASDFQGALDILENSHTALERQHAGARQPRRPLKFGSPDWVSLISSRPEERQGLLSKTVSYLSPENWSDQTKDLVYRLFATSQLAAQASHARQQMQRGSRLEVEAEEMQKQVKKAVPAERVEKIERETSFLGRLLTEKYHSLDKDELILTLTSRYPNIREAIWKVREQFGTLTPNHEQTSAIMDAYRTEQLLKASPILSPFQHLSFAQWWTILTQREELPGDQKVSKPLSEHAIVVRKEQSANVAKTMLQIGDLTGSVLKEYRVHELDRINKYAMQLESLMDKVPQDLMGDWLQLRQHISFLHHKLMESIRETPPEAASLHELAAWIQRVDDVCYGIKMLDEQTEDFFSVHSARFVSDHKKEFDAAYKTALIEKSQLMRSYLDRFRTFLMTVKDPQQRLIAERDAIEAAAKGLTDESSAIRVSSLTLIKTLLEHGKGHDAAVEERALAAAQIGLQQTDRDMLSLGHEIIDQLTLKQLKNLVDMRFPSYVDDPGARIRSLKLLAEVVSKNDVSWLIGWRRGYLILKEELIDQNDSVRDEAMHLLRQLIANRPYHLSQEEHAHFLFEAITWVNDIEIRNGLSEELSHRNTFAALHLHRARDSA